jgi:aspartyl-tRNA(Asn)/glutamyl-tRNA(Gln) amidotransferase subunit A
MKVGNRRVANEVRSATRVAADILTRLGAHVIESAYTLSNPDPIWKVLQQSNWAARFSTASEADRMQLSPTLRAGLDEAFGYSGVDLLKAQVRRTELFRAVQKILTEVDFILTPCVSAPPVSAEYDLAEPLIVDGETVGDLRSEWTTYLSLFDLTGHPALAIPVGFASNGGPLGVQLVTRWYAEAELLAAAIEFENEHPPALWRDTVH